MNLNPTRQELEGAGIKIAVSVPMFHHISDIAFGSIIPIFQRGYGYIHSSGGRVDMNRNKIAQELLMSDYTHVLMLDSDHIHPSDIVERLGRWILDDPKKRVVSGINFRRSPPYDPCVYMVEDGQLAAPLEWEAGIGTADAVGHGCILIEKHVFDETKFPYFAFAYTEDGSQSEDIYFCKQLRDAGIEIWVDTTTTSPHLTNRVITERDFRMYVQYTEQQALKAEKENKLIQVPKSGLILPKMKTKI